MLDNYNKRELKNGIRIITVPMRGSGSAAGLLLVGAGSRYEEKKLNGISHFFEHMAFKGTKNRPSALRIAEEIDSVGAVNNAFTGKEYTGYYIKSAAGHLPMVVDILSDMVRNSLLAEEEIEKEKGVIIEEINMYEDLPQIKVGKNFERLLYGETPLGRQILGSKENIRCMRRKDFIRYMRRLYNPENAVFAAAGGIGKRETEKLAEKGFGPWAGENFSPSAARFIPADDEQKKPEISLESKETEQAHIVLGVRAFRRGHKYRYALSVLSAILGGGMSSRLFNEVREKRGLAYYIRAGAQRYSDAGYLAASAGVDKRRICESVEIILEQFDILRKRKVGVKELTKAKEYLKGGLVLSLEDSHEVAELYATSLILDGKIRTPEEILRKIGEVSAEEVLEAAKYIFANNRLNLAAVGGFARQDRQKLEKLLQL